MIQSTLIGEERYKILEVVSLSDTLVERVDEQQGIRKKYATNMKSIEIVCLYAVTQWELGGIT